MTCGNNTDTHNISFFSKAKEANKIATPSTSLNIHKPQLGGLNPAWYSRQTSSLSIKTNVLPPTSKADLMPESSDDDDKLETPSILGGLTDNDARSQHMDSLSSRESRSNEVSDKYQL